MQIADSVKGNSEHGRSVRSRVGQYGVAPDEEFEVVEHDRQGFVRPVGP